MRRERMERMDGEEEEGGAMIIYSHTVRQPALCLKQGTDIFTPKIHTN